MVSASPNIGYVNTGGKLCAPEESVIKSFSTSFDELVQASGCNAAVLLGVSDIVVVVCIKELFTNFNFTSISILYIE